MPATSLYWHDYETFGTDPKRDRPVQFAGLRTDEALEVIGTPLVVYCQPARDILPHPEACLVTGITPQKALNMGVVEAEFIRCIHQELAAPGTCGVGYNSIRFDDEFTRYLLYRNFFDPYAREWQQGNSRWDIIDTLRLARALRPEGINWPDHSDGRPSFRLEDLTVANDIPHAAAHDALSDVHATIAVARLVKNAQPRLYEFAYRLRDKRQVAQLLDLPRKKPVLHVSSRYPSAYGCTAMVAPVARHPVNKNEIVVYDLRHDPAPLVELDAEEIRARLFVATEDLPGGVERIPLKTVHLNRAPVVVPLNTLDKAAAERLQIDVALGMAHLETLRRTPRLETKIRAVFGEKPFTPEADPEQNLYGGGFFSDEDRARMEQVRTTPPGELPDLGLPFRDERLPEMLFRYRARNYPTTLTASEAARWEEFRVTRLTSLDGGGTILLGDYFAKIRQLRDGQDLSHRDAALLDQLEDYGKGLT